MCRKERSRNWIARLNSITFSVAILALPLGVPFLEPYPSGLLPPVPLAPWFLILPPGIMSLSKPSQEIDPVKGTKMAKRFNDALALALNPEPVLVDPRCCGVSLVNRLFSVMQIHKVILPSVIKEGHDPHRPVPGILCEVTEPGALKAFVEHNVKLSKSPLMPPLDPSLLRYEILGGTHYNTSLRLGRACSKSPSGDLSKLIEEDES